MIDSTPRFFLINKPKNITSFDVIRRLKPFFFELYGKGKGRNKLKIGHFGTLDPFADGLMLIGVGKALRLTELVHEYLKKEYVATGVLGKKSLTGDCDGEIIETNSLEVNTESIIQSLKSFEGVYNQKPSYFSAVKYEGKPLYEYAREGIFIDKDPVERTVYSCEYIERNGDEIRFSTSVSTGTYIRKLWEDCCEKVNTIGFLNALQRTQIGHLSLKNATDLERVSSVQDLSCIGPLDVLPFKQVLINDDQKSYLTHGREIQLDEDAQYLWFIGENNEVVSLGKKQSKGIYRSQINFLNAT